MRRSLRIAALLAAAVIALIAALHGLVWLGERVPMIEETGAEVVEGPLRRVPIRFAQTDFWFYPPRVDAELGRLDVPRLHARPEEGSLEIQFVRFPATDPETGEAPIVYLAGGPGGSGVATASGDRFPFFMKLREAGDVIALDQRGTRHTEPFPVCPEEWKDDAENADNYEPMLRDCWRHFEGILDPNAFTTPQSAADLESLRVALGVERLSLVGISYGTHLALAYIRDYPDRVARAVLAGVEGPDHTYKLPSVVDGVLREIDRTLETEAGWSGLVTDLGTALERLRRERPTVGVEDPWTGEEVEVTLDPSLLKLAVLYGFGEREDFLRAARRIRAIAEGDDEMLARFSLLIRGSGRLPMMPLSMDCASGASEERLARIGAEEPDSLIGDVINLDLTSTCPFWPVDDLGADYRAPIVSNTEVLAISGTLDPRTPPSNADEVLAGFANGRHLLLVGAGHGDDLLIGTPAIGEVMVRFLSTGELERERIVLPSL